VSEKQNKKHFFFCFAEREYLGTVSPKIVQTERSTKKKKFFSFISEHEYLGAASPKIAQIECRVSNLLKYYA